MKVQFCNRVRVAICAASALITLQSAGGQTSVLTQHNDNARTGTNLHETVLTPANVNQQQFGRLFRHPVDDQLYTQPLVASGVQIEGGTHDLVLVSTVNNSVYAFDARDASSAKPFWHVNFGAPATLHDAAFGCLDINGAMGIIGAPVIDPKQKTLYIVALTRAGGKFEQRLHALDLATGADLPGSPVTITAPGFDPLLQNQRPALVLASGRVYIGYASHCDKLPYHGYLLSYDARTLRQLAVFNTSPGGEGASIWQSGQAPSVDEAGNLYIITGNGSWNGTTQWSESFLKLDRNLKLLDWFTPTNHVALDKADADLDSSGATLIPGTHVVLGGGKQGILYLLDTQHLGHLGDEHSVQNFKATASHIHSLVYWESAKNGRLLYVWGQRDKERVYRFTGSRTDPLQKLETQPWMTRPDANQGHPGAMLSLSANGQKDGILWAAIHATGDSWHESRPGILHAYDADDIGHELWNSLENAGRDDCGNYSKMAAPTIANGMVYLASFGTDNIGTGQLCAYGLLGGGGPKLDAPSNVHASVARGFITIDWKPVDGAESYMVESTQAEHGGEPGKPRVVARGLTRPGFTEAAAAKGTPEYRVIAVNANGAGARSAAAEVTIEVVPAARMNH
jgi:hypothetical protein